MLINLDNWCEYLSKITPNHPSTSHPWICEVKRGYGTPKIEILSKEEYDSFFEKNSRWDHYRRKLPLKQIITFSQNLMSEINQSNQTRLVSLTSSIDVLSPNLENSLIGEFINNLKEIECTTQKLRMIPNSLQKRHQCTRNKRLAKKTENIWGFIRWYIWSWFFDQSKEIGEIQKIAPKPNETFEFATAMIQDRLLLNMDAFEEAVHINGTDHHLYVNETTFEKFDTPAKVKKLWLTKYAEGTYGPVSEQANIHRQRVVGALKVWKALKKLKKSTNS